MIQLIKIYGGTPLFDVLTMDLLCFSLKLVYLHYHRYKYTETA